MISGCTARTRQRRMAARARSGARSGVLVPDAPALVVNRLQAMATNSSKPYQFDQLRNLGFKVPEILITTSPDATRDFWERHGDVIYKSISSIRSIVSRLQPEQAERLADVAFCATQFQRQVPGTDHRVHVVGDEVFASEVLSEADDYRYPEQHEVEIRARRLPQAVEDRCGLASLALKLPVAGIDLRRTPEGDWYCFEVNPLPAFTYCESRTGQPVGNAIARFLAAGPQGAPGLAEIYESDEEKRPSQAPNAEATRPQVAHTVHAHRASASILVRRLDPAQVIGSER